MNNHKTIFWLCKLYALAMHICLMLDMWTESDVYQNAIYATLRGNYDAALHASAQNVVMLDFMDPNNTVEQVEQEDLEDSETREFASWLAARLRDYTWPLDKFIPVMQEVVRWIDTHDYSERTDDMCDIINSVFLEAGLEGDMVTFIADSDIIEKLDC